ncbi:MAG: sulfatase-like hydrolase/transferase [Phycisphaera sp.]|nr:sulfatase-like hydrolase/transferase [Phycisphaera sp.]
MNKKPNILYIHSHDTGRYIQPFGHAVPTPALQKLAEQGVLFRQNFCINPTCSPSRAALLTGCYPHENGMTGLAHRGWALYDYKQHIIHTLKKAGYTSALAGVQHVAHAKPGDPEAWKTIGYDRYFGRDGQNQALEFLSNPPEEPFFLTVGYGQTHREFPELSECPDDPRYCLPPSPLPDTPETRIDMARYKASARILDQKMGEVFDALDKNGLSDNTLVICTTDHGIAFPRMKCNLQDSGIGTMLMLRLPGVFEGGKVVDAMTTHMDLFPTVCELVGVEAPPWLRGKSLMPLMRSETRALHGELFFQVNYHAAYQPMRAVRTKRWKYIRRFYPRPKPVFTNIDDGESKTYWLENGLADQTIPKEALYDLCFDPNETNNLITPTTEHEAANDMRDRLHRFMVETNDPMLNGPIAAPQGAVVNDINAISPKERPTPAKA